MGLLIKITRVLAALQWYKDLLNIMFHILPKQQAYRALLLQIMLFHLVIKAKG